MFVNNCWNLICMIITIACPEISGHAPDNFEIYAKLTKWNYFNMDKFTYNYAKLFYQCIWQVWSHNFINFILLAIHLKQLAMKLGSGLHPKTGPVTASLFHTKEYRELNNNSDISVFWTKTTELKVWQLLVTCHLINEAFLYLLVLRPFGRLFQAEIYLKIVSEDEVMSAIRNKS